MSQPLSISDMQAMLRGHVILTAEDEQEVLRIVDRFPYFQLPQALHLYHVCHARPDDFRQVCRKYALNVAHPQQLADLLKTPCTAAPAETVPEAQQIATEPSPEAPEPVMPETAAPEEPVTEVQPESAAPEEPHRRTPLRNLQAAIDSFISDCAGLTPQETDFVVDIASSIRPDEDIATETLAQIYAQQRLYKKSIAVYRKLILKYPEKNAYFASQIESLEKELI